MSLIHALARWLTGSWLSNLVTAHGWIVPAIQVVHIVAIAAVVIAALLINLRALGVMETGLPARAVQARWLPVIGWAVVVLALTGVLLIASEPGRALFRWVFWVKLGLIVVALAVTNLHRRLADGTGVARLVAVISLVLWFAVILAGRWIAYADGWQGAAS